jgi:mannose-6-phosphate isomerase
MDVCPLVFEPIYKPKIWGGRHLARLLGRELPGQEPIGEAWECADLPTGQSVVARGPQKGRTLHELCAAWGTDLLGHAPAAAGRFPLLIKYLDAADNLSIQVHPAPDAHDSAASPAVVKNEAWHVLSAAKRAVIYRGLRPGVTPEAVATALQEGAEAVTGCLHAIPVSAGETYYMPGGTVHALGAGIVVAEIQTPSDTTYRLFDWGRTRPDSDAGLDVEKGLAAIREGVDFGAFEKRCHVGSVFATVTRLITCPSFQIERVRFIGGVEQAIPYAEPVCWIVLEGSGQICHGRDGVETFSAGDVALLPAKLAEPRLKTDRECLWLEVTIPVASDLAGHPRPDARALRAEDHPPGGPIPLNVDIRRP